MTKERGEVEERVSTAGQRTMQKAKSRSRSDVMGCISCLPAACLATFLTVSGSALLAGSSTAQPPPAIAALVDLLRLALPYPGASADGEMPDVESSQHQWFVVWPSAGDTRVTIRANPLHPETQKVSAAAMNEIQQSVMKAERKAQASYDRALADLRRTGTTTELESISLDDEGVAGDRIDAELELTIELENNLLSFDVDSGVAPIVERGGHESIWVVSVLANTYRRSVDQGESFRAAETRLFFGLPTKPHVTSVSGLTQHTVDIRPDGRSFAVVLRGNEALLRTVVTTVKWGQLAP